MSATGPVSAPALYRYGAYGLVVEVERPIANLPPAQHDNDEPLRIRFGSVPAELDGAEAGDEEFSATADSYLSRLPGFWRLLVRNGTDAVFQPLLDPCGDRVWYAGVSNAIGIAGYQRGMFPVHGSSVLFPRGAVAMMGNSGVGKSTLVAGLSARGIALFTDDLCLVRPAGKSYRVGRGAPEMRLMPDAAAALGGDAGRAIAVGPDAPKLLFGRDISSAADADLFALVDLAFGDGPPRLERLQGTEPLGALIGALRLRMGLHLLPADRRAAAFDLVCRIAGDIPVYRFTRPRDFAQFDAGLDLLIDAFGD